MIARVKGKIIEKTKNSLFLDVNGICYEILLPTTVIQRLDEAVDENGFISLITYHYLHVEPSRNIPILIGFLNEIEKEFFEAFITVSGIGPRAAIRALNQPISMIAKAIDDGDLLFLTSLPGIGQQRAKEIIAKLQNKVGKFGLIQDLSVKTDKLKKDDIIEEALSVLMQLEYKKPEAMGMLKKAMERMPGIATTEELLNEVYRQRKVK